MADWREVMAARAHTDEMKRSAVSSQMSSNEMIVYSNLAVAAAVQELGMMLDYCAHEVVVALRGRT